MFEIMKIFGILFILTLIHAEDDVSINESTEDLDSESLYEAKKFDINAHYQQLFKNANGNHLFLRKYLEIPDSHTFLNSDSLALRPVKMVNYTDLILPLFDNWNKEFFIKNNFFSYFSFGSVYRNNEEEPSDEINLKNAIETFHSDSNEELSFKFTMPYFVREKIELPDILNCSYLDDKFNSVNMEFHLNLKEYTPTKVPKQDQVLCVINGNMSMMMLNETHADKLANLKSKLDKSTYKITEFLTPNLHPGECLYIPIGWNFALTSKQTWFYTISWEHTLEYFESDRCENATRSNKLINYKFNNDKQSKEESNKEVGLILYFYIYIHNNSTNELSRTNFLESFKNDKNLSVITSEWDETNDVLVSEIFDSLDLNKDNILSLVDLEFLTETLCKNAVDTITRVMENIRKKFAEKMESKQGILDEIMAQLKNIEFDDEKEALVREKVSEFMYNLPENVKEMFKKENFDLEEILMGEIDKASSSKRNRKDRPKVEKQKEQQTSKEVQEETSQTFVEIDSELVEDLDAETLTSSRDNDEL